jgi:amphi-Trp domain-containing protein
MGREKRVFKSEERKSRAEVSDFLRELAGRVADGRVVLRQDERETVLQIPPNVSLEIQVEEEAKPGRGIEQSLEIEIKWIEGDTGAGSVQLA